MCYEAYYAAIDVLAECRRDAMGFDARQTSWVTAKELFYARDMLTQQGVSDFSLLDIGSGISDLNAFLFSDMRLSRHVRLDEIYSSLGDQVSLGSAELVSFSVDESLPFQDGEFDVVTAFDSICHMGAREPLIRDMFRVLKRGGLLLFVDSLVVSSDISADEIARRSLFGRYVFVPNGFNERVIQDESRGVIIKHWDETFNSAVVFREFLHSRIKRQAEICAVEGFEWFEKINRYLRCCEKLAIDRKLSRQWTLAQRA